MKKLFKYVGVLLSAALLGAVAGCTVTEEDQGADLGLNIKVFSPSKVVTGSQMTINGSGFKDVTEVVFPDAVGVSNFEIVTDGMIRVTVPAGISAEGGKIKVVTADDEAESTLALTVGKTEISGFSKNVGESVQGGEQITIFGKDLEFISAVELLDADGNPVLIPDSAFYRKGTSTVIFYVPKKVFEGTFTGKVYTIDGRVFQMPELAYEPATDGEGHWETVKTTIWKNEDPAGNGAVAWNGTYRFALEGMDTNDECIAELPEDVWEKMKTSTFYLLFQPADPTSYQVRVTNGWWDAQWLGQDNDFAPWNMADQIIDNEDGTFYIEINFGDDPVVETFDEKHILFTGNGYTPLELYFAEEVWVDGGGHLEIVRTPLWTNDDPAGNGKVSWNGTYRFALEGHDGNDECIAEFPEDVWNIIKTGTFYLLFQPADPTSYQVRITNGWWDTQWLGQDNDFAPWNMADQIIDNEDGTFSIEIHFGDDPIVETLDEKHLLFTGDGYTPLEIYTVEEVWVGGGGDSGPKEVDFWTNDDPVGNGKVSWNGTYRFALEGHDGNSECIAEFPADVWEKIKTGTFYIQYEPVDPTSYQVRVTNGWWDTQWLGQDNDFAPWNMADQIIDNEDGTFHIEINFGDDPIVGTLDEKHLLFTGDGYTPLRLYFME